MGLILPTFTHEASGATLSNVYLTLLSDMSCVRCVKRRTGGIGAPGSSGKTEYAVYGEYRVYASLDARNANRPSICSDVISTVVDHFDANPVNTIYALLKLQNPGAVDA